MELDGFRHFIVRESLRAELLNRMCGKGASVRYDDDCMHALSKHWIVTPNDGTFQNAFEAGDDILNFSTEDLEATTIYHVFFAIEHTYETVGVHRSDVPGPPETLNEFARVRVRSAPIARHDHGSCYPEL